ncbi:MAG TPA: hypothetical protein VG488_12680 [Candidatus Angelobacter sp.]|nr:hypothetical protein [Candidatus Angelobacter sp.]
MIVYDGDGNRVSETVAGNTTSYLVADVNPTGYAQVIDEVQGTYRYAATPMAWSGSTKNTSPGLAQPTSLCPTTTAMTGMARCAI